MTSKETTIIILYYAFTSLTTVGFGDLHPRSNVERIFVSITLLTGVAIFSYIMGNFIEIIGQMMEINSSFHDGDNLDKFFGLIKRFNMNKLTKHELRA
jgi:hypothetical protein